MNTPAAKSSGAEVIYQETGRLIRNAREARRMSQERLAVAVGLSRTSITNIEKGRQKLLLHTLADIAVVLGIGLHELLPASGVKVPLEQRLPKDLGTPERKWIRDIIQQS